MPEGSHRFEVGSVYCTVLADGYFSYPSSWLFPNADRVQLARALAERRLPLETVLGPYTCLLMETGRSVVLVDAGAGEGSSAAGAIVARLEMVGIRPRHVDTVIFTHAHPDHIGGAVDAHGRPVFPNARCILAERELEFWENPRADLSGLRVPGEVGRSIAAAVRRRLAELRLQLEPVAGEIEVCPGVTVLPAPGHTPGHLAVVVSSNGQRLLHMGDAAVHPLHLEHPEWESGFDLAAETALATRRSLLARAVAEDMRVMAFHFPFPSVGRVKARDDGGWDWMPGC